MKISEPDGIKLGARNSTEDKARIRDIRTHAKAIHGMTMEMEPSDADAEGGQEGSSSQGEDATAKAITPRPDVTEADKERAKQEYGDVNFADEKNKKYPLDTEKHIRAAWSYIGQEKNQAKYSAEEVAAIQKKIIAAWKDKVDKEGPPSEQKKDASLMAEYNAVQEDFNEMYSHFNDSPMTSSGGWMVDAFDGYVIGCFSGTYYKIPYTKDGEETVFAPRDQWEEVRSEPNWVVEPGKSMDFEQAPESDVSISYGGEIKALGETPDGLNIGGYLVRFSTDKDPDLVGDFFTKDTDFGEATSSPMYFHHGLDAKLGKRKMGKVTLKQDDFGVWAEGILSERDEYEKFIGEQIGAGKMGFSSGTASHLVEREPSGHASNWVKSWPLGLDASPTHIPAEPRNTIVPLKSLVTAPVAATSASADQTKSEGDFTMDEKTKLEMAALIADAFKAPAFAEAVKAAIPAAPVADPDPEVKGKTGIIIEAKKGPVQAKIDPTDDNDGIKAMTHFIRTGEIAHDLRPDVGYKNYAPADDGTGNLKVYNWSEGGTNDGYALVPPEYWKNIVEKRYEMSVMRAAGCQVMPCSSDKMMVPTEYTREAVFVKTTEATGASDQTSTEPVVSKEIDIFLYSRFIPVTIQLLNDSAYPIEAFVSSRLAHAAALTDNSLFLVGSGNGATDPEGVYVGGTAGKTLASATAIAQGEPEALFYSLPSQYQAEAVWMMRNATLGKLRAITGNWFAYQPTPAGQTTGKGAGNVGGTAEGLLYHNIWVSDYNAAVAASAKSLIVGNPLFYGIAENQGMLIQRNPWDDAKHHIVNFYAYIRVGGAVLQSEAWSYATHPSA